MKAAAVGLGDAEETVHEKRSRQSLTVIPFAALDTAAHVPPTRFLG